MGRPAANDDDAHADGERGGRVCKLVRKRRERQHHEVHDEIDRDAVENAHDDRPVGEHREPPTRGIVDPADDQHHQEMQQDAEARGGRPVRVGAIAGEPGGDGLHEPQRLDTADDVADEGGREIERAGDEAAVEHGTITHRSRRYRRVSTVVSPPCHSCCAARFRML
jgi:hypothetical protein